METSSSEESTLAQAQGKAKPEDLEKVVVPETQEPAASTTEEPAATTTEETAKTEEPVKTDDGEEYELEIAEDSLLTEEDLDAVVAYAEKHNLSKEDAEQLLKDREAVYQRGNQANYEMAKRVFEAEKQKLLSDPAFKGEKLTESLATIDLVVEKVGGSEMREFLKGPAGNSLPLAKFLLKIGNLMKSDTFVGRGNPANSQQTSEESKIFQKMYPNFFEEK